MFNTEHKKAILYLALGSELSVLICHKCPQLPVVEKTKAKEDMKKHAFFMGNSPYIWSSDLNSNAI